MALALDDRDRRILALAVPALFTLAVEPLYVLVDTAIVGRLGATQLAGLALASTVLTTLLWAFNFLSFGVTTRVAFETGAGDRRAASGVAVQALWLALVLGCASALVVAFAAEPLARVLGGHGASLHAAVTYLHISAISMPAALIMLASHGVFRGWSDTRTPLTVALVSNVINVVLEVVFVYAFDWGVAGSAWGTVIAQLLAAAWLVGLIGRAVVATGARLRPAMEEARRLLSIGRHIVVRTASLLAALALATAAAARVGTTALGGHQIAQQMFVFLALATDALAVAAQALVGTASGAGDTVEADADSSRLLRLGLIVGAALMVVVLVTSPVLPHVFSSDAEVIHAATIALVFLALMQIPGSVVFVLDGVLMGRSAFAYVKWVTLAALVAYIPFAAAAFARPANGLAVVWGGLVVWMCVRAALNYRRYASA
ncbi:MAG TPA: MATE family efflux transporter [Acidimicrobiales bacterium]|nr:MATE family efflux transporter [Acidimicrobiales bacterium]